MDIISTILLIGTSIIVSSYFPVLSDDTFMEMQVNIWIAEIEAVSSIIPIIDLIVVIHFYICITLSFCVRFRVSSG
jgi:arginine utilization protein RocB